MAHLGKGFWLIRGVPGQQSPTWDKTLLTHFGPVMQPPVRELNDPDRGVIRIDDFALLELFALRQALRLFGQVPMDVAGGLQVAKQALALGFTQMGGSTRSMARWTLSSMGTT